MSTIEELFVKERKVSYEFRPKHRPLSPGDNLTRLEKILFASAAKQSLKLHRVRARVKAIMVYRLSSEHHHAFVDFILKDGGVRLLALHASPDEDFLISSFVKAIFDAGAAWVGGSTGDDELLKFYARFGFEIDPKRNTFVLMASPDAPKAS